MIETKSVFILGAGASKQAGAPLMAEFLDVASDLWKLGLVGESKDSFEQLFRGISYLQRVHSKSKLDIHNIESVFSSFDMALILNRFAEYKSEQISELVSSVKNVIVKTIEHTLKIPCNEKGKLIPPHPYDKFANLIKYLSYDSKPKHSLSIITFNYDLALDFTFHNRSIPVNYNLDKTNTTTDLPLLKLHGSLNWGYCPECSKVYPWTVTDFFKEYSITAMEGITSSVTLDLGSKILNKSHSCGTLTKQEIVIVPPTWNKGDHQGFLTNVWASAATQLSKAENIFVIGYSLPETDQFFRYLYALGSVGQNTLRRFWVFDPDNSGTVEKRFHNLLGSAALQRFEYYPIPFDIAIGKIQDSFSG